MTVNIENEYEKMTAYPLTEDMMSEIAETIINASLDYVNCPYESEINVTLTDNENIREINKMQRNIDSSTDVLSFPMLDFSVPGDFSDAEAVENFNPETGELLLGDIVISLDKVLSQSMEFNHSPKREFAFLIAHSMLHLSGYDHIDDNERAVMEKMQDEILKSCGYTRDID